MRRELTFTIKTLGCKVNQYDSQLMRERLLSAGYKESSNGDSPDICIINTCTVTSNADRKARGLIRKMSRENPSSRVVVTGCYSDRAGGEVKRIAGVDMVFGNEGKGDIAARLGSQFSVVSSRYNGITDFNGRTRALVKIQDGCDNPCSYCIVPYVRGRPRSRPLADIKREVTVLAEKGFKEVVLSGICLGAYGKDLSKKKGLVEVIDAIENITGLYRIRLSSIEPDYAREGLIEELAASPKLCRHLHIPLQSGDDRILRRMNRRYSGGDYLKLVAKIRKAVADIAITTDVLVGFPGETDDAFRNTLKLVKKMKPSRVHIFPYSKRDGTKSANFDGEIKKDVIQRRIKVLKAVARDCAMEYKRRFIGRTEGVLVEGALKETPGLLYGHTDTYLKVVFSSKTELINEMISAKLASISPAGDSLQGTLA